MNNGSKPPMDPKRIKTWHIVVAMLFVGIVIALFLRFRDSESTHRFADPDRESIYQSGLAACIGRAQAEVAGAQPPVSMEAIEAYCDCAMGGVVEQLSETEIELFYQTETLSDETTATMAAIANACSQQFLPQ